MYFVLTRNLLSRIRTSKGWARDWPLYAEYHADLRLDKRRYLTPSYGEIPRTRLAHEVILSKKE